MHGHRQKKSRPRKRRQRRACGLTAPEVAKLLRLHRTTVYRLLRPLAVLTDDGLRWPKASIAELIEHGTGEQHSIGGNHDQGTNSAPQTAPARREPAEDGMHGQHAVGTALRGVRANGTALLHGARPGVCVGDGGCPTPRW